MYSAAWRFAWGHMVPGLIVVLIVYLSIDHLTTSMLEDTAQQTVGRYLDRLRQGYYSAGLEGLNDALNRILDDDTGERPLYLLFDPVQDEVVSGNLDIMPTLTMFNGSWEMFSLSRRAGDRPVTIGMRGAKLSTDLWILAGQEMNIYTRFQTVLKQSFISVLALIVVITLSGGYLLSRFLLHRIKGIAETADEIMLGNLTRRIHVTSTGDEFEHLVSSLNQMISRIDELMVTTRAVTDSVAHDFRSPLTRLKSNLEFQLNKAGSVTELRTSIHNTLNEIDTLLQSLNALLEIIRVEGNLSREQMTEVNLQTLVEGLCEFYKPVAEDKGLDLLVESYPVTPISGHTALLTQAVFNLVDNAIKFSDSGTQITVTVNEGDSGPYIVVADRGPGIPPELREHVMQRFTRLDQSRAEPGAGLGLSLVAAVMKQHGATISLADNQPGLKVTLQFTSPVIQKRMFPWRDFVP